MKEYEGFARIGTEPHRSYYIPFAEMDNIRTKHGIQGCASSSRFMSIDGVWQIKQHVHVDDRDINEELVREGRRIENEQYIQCEEINF